MASGLVEGLAARRIGARWLLTEALPDWDLACVVVTETHSATEAFWHGVDPRHPLHGHPSAPHAAKGMQRVFEEADRLVAELVEELRPDRTLVFAFNGMANNRMDVPSMCLLPELLFRAWSGRARLHVPPPLPGTADDLTGLLGRNKSWHDASSSWFGNVNHRARPLESVTRDIRRKLGAVRSRVRSPVGRSTWQATSGPSEMASIDWHPSMMYRDCWHLMPAFALPSYSLGRIRINLKGREREGTVDPAAYARTCQDIAELVSACRDARTGEPVVERLWCAPDPDPLDPEPTRADIQVLWRENVTSFRHPAHGTIGPLPFRRLADHCGDYGFAFVQGIGIAPEDGGIRSELDLAATVVDLVDLPPLSGLSGESLLGPAR
jgi:hypothetical protein